VRNLKAELLVPVGNQEALQAAVQSGADAVYLGGQKFNARGRAQNFSNEQLIEAIKYAHLYGVKVYVTFNTLIKQKELAEAMDFAEFLYDNHCDAVIVQDLGIAAMIKKYFPRLELHASTQMTIHNLEGARMLEDMGFKRVVLARELSLEEIKYIRQRANLELETFIHGALCICYSGQCLMSSMIGGRSGNRGLCAQPCRLSYRLEKAGLNKTQEVNRYLLSTKDLAAYPFLPELVKAGIKAFKIEGRLKRPEYIAVVTRIYRKLLDNIYEGDLPGYSLEDEEDLLQIFNRGGFCSGYYYGYDGKELVCTEKPGHWGVYIGKVVNVRDKWVDIRLESELEIGDGIQFRNHYQNDEWGQEVSRMQSSDGRLLNKAFPGNIVSVRIESKSKLPSKATVWRVSKKGQIEEATNQYSDKYGKKIPVAIRGVFKKEQLPLIEIQDLNGIKGIAYGEQKVQSARKAPLSRQDIEKQINRLGDTPFKVDSLNVDMDDDIFMPLSAINELRRRAVSNLIENRISSMERPVVKSNGTLEISYIDNMQDLQTKKAKSDKSELYIYTKKILEDDEILNVIDGLCFTPGSWDFDLAVLRNYTDRLKEKRIKTRLVLPRIMRKEDIEILEKIPGDIWNMFDSYLAGNLGAIYFLKRMGVENIIGDAFLNIFNSIAVQELASLGVKGVVLSQELTYREIEDIVDKFDIPCEIMIFGYIPLMIMEYCPVGDKNKDCKHCRLKQGWQLIDRKGMAFPLRRRGIARCYTEILNSHVLLVADEMERIARTGVERFGLNLTEYKLEDIKEIVALHRFAVEHPGQDFPHEMEDLLSRLKIKGYTRGHFFRGVE